MAAGSDLQKGIAMSCGACAWATYDTPHDLSLNEYKCLVILGDQANQDDDVYLSDQDCARWLDQYGVDVRGALDSLEQRGLVEAQELLDLSLRIHLNVTKPEWEPCQTN